MTPTDELKSLLLETYQPCRFFGQCREAQWGPESGHIPRGYVGATGSPEDVEVIMVFAEPGHPHADERYDAALGAEGLMAACTSHAYESFKNGTDLFHRNVRWFISQLYPDMTFDEQLQRVWLTEGRLCSIDVEIGKTTDRTCAANYLVEQIRLLPNAAVVAFGGKAKHYLNGLGVDFIAAYALAPPGANHKPARPSWEAAIEAVKARRQ
ncbi:MAG: hypothetical protein LCH92_12490 [Proteobacteria bacterium]|nr:hypothetical protein [Pseudomonadota bacterium]